MDRSDWRERRNLAYEARKRLDGEYLIGALIDGDARVRRAAAMHLGEIREPSAVTPLLRVLDVRDEPLRIIAIKSLADIGDAGAGSRLVELAEDESVPLPTRTTAIVALLELRHPAAIDLLSALLSHPKSSYRRWALRQLGKIDDPQARSALEHAEETAGPFLRWRIRRLMDTKRDDPTGPPMTDQDQRVAPATRTFIEEAIAPALARELALYERFLENAERAVLVASASRFFRPGLLIVTDRRVVFFRHPVFLGAPRITSVDHSTICRAEPATWGEMGIVRLATVRGRLSFRFLRPASVAEEVTSEIVRFLPSDPEDERCSRPRLRRAWDGWRRR